AKAEITASVVSARGSSEVRFDMVCPLGVSCDSRQNTAPRGLFRHDAASARRPASDHIGGVRPSRPTLTRLVSNEPSGSGLMKAITLAPALRSDLSAGT